jgi:hypothetical protein
MEKVEKQPNGCWRFMGAKTPEGYGRVNLTGDGRGWVGAHVLSYELHIGPIPEGMELDHVQARGCRFRDCVNPDHLEPVTPLENNLRREVHTRGTCVNGHPRTPENTLYKPNGAVKQCRVCQRERQRGRRR